MKTAKSVYALLGALVSLTCVAGNQSDGAVPLIRAVHCLESKSFLPHSDEKELAFGYFLDTKSWPGKRMLYIVDYSNPSRPRGFVYTIFLGEHDGKQVFDIQNNAKFVLSKNGYHGVSFVQPPLGGDWTHEHLGLAISEIEKRPRTTVSVQALRRTDPSFVCESYTDPQ